MPYKSYLDLNTNLERLQSAQAFQGCSDPYADLDIPKFQSQIDDAARYLRHTLDMRWVSISLFVY